MCPLSSVGCFATFFKLSTQESAKKCREGEVDRNWGRGEKGARLWAGAAMVRGMGCEQQRIRDGK
jgi:hypothetical protein